MSLSLKHWPDPSLRTVAFPVVDFDDNLSSLVAEMSRIMYANKGAGLAATQIGVALRVVVMDVSPTQSDLKVFVNPVILDYIGSRTLQEEGCLSFPGVVAEVPRYTEIKGYAYTTAAERFDFCLTGFEAQCLQHEREHLDGVVMTDHMNRAQRRFVEKSLRTRRT